MINEILQWIVLVWAIWSIHCLGKAINMSNDVIKEMIDWTQDGLDKKISKKPRKSLKDRLKEEMDYRHENKKH